MKKFLPKAKLQSMVIYIIHFKLQKNKIGIALGFLSIDLIQREGVNCNYSSWKINCGGITYLMNFQPKFTCLIKISDYLIPPYTKGD